MNEIVRSYGTKVTDPAELGYPPMLPIEIALKTAPLHEIKQAYGYTDEEWMALKTDPIFLRDLKEAVEMVKEEGMSFKLKARLQADELLKSSWRLIHGPKEDVPATVKADLIKATMRWAGYEQKPGADVLQGGTALNIQINL
jgi:hypothetical protein